MRYRELHDGTLIPVIGLGTWRMGGASEPDPSQDELVLQAIRSALEMGYAHIDTAEMYGGGHTEELIGQVIRDFDRKSLFITSKVWHSHLRYPDVLQACENSLHRLGTDYLDLYLIHWPNQSVPLDETFRGLNELVRAGQVRYLGVSNFDLEQLVQAWDMSETPLVTNQVPYSISNRMYARNGVLEFCRKHKMILTAYSPVDKGQIAEIRKLNLIASRLGVSPAQVALGWLVTQPDVIAIPKSLNREHLLENLEAAHVILGVEEMNILDQLSGSGEDGGEL